MTTRTKKHKPTPKPEIDTRLSRRLEIGKTIHDAMGAYEKSHKVDWTKAGEQESNNLNEVLTQYVEGTASREDVKRVYQQYVQTCVVV